MIVEPSSFEPGRFEILVEAVGLGGVRRPLGERASPLLLRLPSTNWHEY
jgi:hypothetical protein